MVHEVICGMSENVERIGQPNDSVTTICKSVPRTRRVCGLLLQLWYIFIPGRRVYCDIDVHCVRNVGYVVARIDIFKCLRYC